MATVTRYVNTASSAGGDGTTNGTAGATRAFPSLAAAVAYLKAGGTGDGSGGHSANLVTNTESLDIVCSGTTEDTSTVNIANGDFTTNATYYLHVRSADDHAGAWNTAAYRLVAGYDANGGTIYCDLHTSKWSGLQVEQTGSGNYAVSTFHFTTNAANITIERCILRGTYAGTGSGGAYNGIWLETTGSTKVSNTLIYGFNRTNPEANDSAMRCAYGPIYVYNCTIVNCYRGVVPVSSTLVAINVLTQSCGDGFVGSFDGASNYNLSDLAADAPGANSKNSTTVTFVGAPDYHLAAGDTGAKDAGTPLNADASYPISVDIDNVTRSGSWDIGADEVASSSTPPLYLLRSRQIGLSGLSL